MRFFAVLAALIVPLAAYFPVYQDREATIESGDKEIRELDMHIEQARAAEKKLPQFRAEFQLLNNEVTKLRRILPPDPAVNEIRDVIEKAADTSAVRLERFQPRKTSRADYVEAPIDTEAVGNLDALASFFDAVRNKSRIINVSDLTLQRADPGLWRAKFLMTTFALPD
jgi:Tfp pilus assembly protein PilO